MQTLPRNLTRTTRATIVEMADIASRELRNQTREVLARVEAGEHVTITVNGRRVAVLVPAENRRRWMPRSEFLRRLYQADAGLRVTLAELSPDSTDDLPAP
jgi:prevent-host-death family protein